MLFNLRAGPAAFRTSTSGNDYLYGYEVVRAHPHDPAAFTQGLVYQAGFLYEGTGLYNASSIRKVSLETGEVLQKQTGGVLLGEGITINGEDCFS